MSLPNLKFNDKRIKVSPTVRVVSPFPPIAPYTMRFQFVDTPLCQSSSFDPTLGPGDSSRPDWKWNYGTWTHVTGNVYDWTFQDESWCKKFKQGSSTYWQGAFQIMSADGGGSEAGRRRDWNTIAYKILGANLTGVKYIPCLFKQAIKYLVSMAPIDTSHIECAGSFLSGGSNATGASVYLTTLPSFDFSSIDNSSYPAGLTVSEHGYGLEYCFYRCASLVAAPNMTFPSNRAVNTNNMFDSCSNLTSASSLSTLKTSHAEYMFNRCSSLTTVPLIDTSLCLRMTNMFYSCSALTSIPLFDTSSCTHLTEAFSGCYSVESGALALYQKASTQAVPPSSHRDCFTDCGRDTVTGAAELAQIPTGWGGTMA